MEKVHQWSDDMVTSCSYLFVVSSIFCIVQRGHLTDAKCDRFSWWWDNRACIGQNRNAYIHMIHTYIHKRVYYAPNHKRERGREV